MQAWIDDSGAKGQGGYLTLAGFIGTAEVWAAFSDEWKRELDASPPLKFLSTSDAALLGGLFRGWPAWKRDAKLRRLLQIVNRFPLTLIYSSLDLAVHEEMFPKGKHPRKGPGVRRANTLLRQPYGWCFISICTAVLRDLRHRGLRDRFELMFDEQKIMAPRLKDWYPVVLQALEPDERAMMPMEPLFRDDQEFMPLQIADFVAWMIRTEHCGEDHALRQVAKELHISQSPYCQRFTREKIIQLQQQDRDPALQEPDFEKMLREFVDMPRGIEEMYEG